MEKIQIFKELMYSSGRTVLCGPRSQGMNGKEKAM
jgi:hypothetical protein